MSRRKSCQVWTCDQVPPPKKLKKSKVKESRVQAATVSLVDKNQKQISHIEFEVLGEMFCNAFRAVSKRQVAYGFVYVGKWCFDFEDLKAFGYTPKNGQLINAWVRRLPESSNCVKIQYRLDTDLRSLSDMRNKPAWRSLPWLEPAIEAIYAERDRLTCETGIEYHVDHIHPINHPRSCGLTVPWNLQVIPAVENLRKSNRLEV